MLENIYTSGAYAANHPTWHVEDSLLESQADYRDDGEKQYCAQNHLQSGMWGWRDTEAIARKYGQSMHAMGVRNLSTSF